MRRDDDLDKELRFHIASRIDDLVAGGLTPEEARRQTRLEFGGMTQIKEAVRDQRAWSHVEGLLQDVRLAFRTLRSTPVVSLVAVLAGLVGVRGTAKAGLAAFSLIENFVAVFEGSQTRFHIVKLRRGDDILRTRRQNRTNFLL